MPNRDEDHDVGDYVEIELDVSELSDEPAEPGNVALKVRKPGGVLVDYPTPAHSGTGKFTQGVLLDVHGLWRWRWVTSSGVTLAEAGSLYVRPNEFGDG